MVKQSKFKIVVFCSILARVQLPSSKYNHYIKNVSEIKFPRFHFKKINFFALYPFKRKHWHTPPQIAGYNAEGHCK